MRIVVQAFLLCFCSVVRGIFGDDGFFKCHSGNQTIRASLVCTGLAQCQDCSDEINCELEDDQFSCNTPTVGCFREKDRCDGQAHCINCYDEKGCEPQSVFFCEDEGDCISVDQVCNGRPDCHDKSDEKNIGFGFKCPAYEDRRGSQSRCILPQDFVDRYRPTRAARCLNNDDQCFDSNTGFLNINKCWPCLDGTIIHRQQFRDNVFDCPDLSDECLSASTDEESAFAICASLLSNSACARNEVSCSKDGKPKCIAVSKICDDNVDCDNRIDEKFCTRLSVCPSQNFEKFTCSKTRDNMGSHETIYKCDGKVDCIDAEDECQSNCTNQLKYCELISPIDYFVRWGNLSNCTEAVETGQLCDTIPDCSDGIDERYCNYSRFCNESDPTAGMFIDRCNVERCNLQADCKNIADESNCSLRTHFYCDDNKTFVPVWKKFDGQYDCDDYSDECAFSSDSVSSQTKLVDNTFLNISLWIFMLLAVIGNAIVITKTSIDLNTMLRRRLNCTSHRVGVCNKTMILNLAVSDFLMGLYLLLIAAEAVQFNGIYCTVRKQWLISSGCTFAGVIAMVSGQTSVLLMVLMTSYRLYGVMNPFNAEKVRCKAIYIIIVFIWFISFLLAIVPILPGNAAVFATELRDDQPYVPSLDLTALVKMTATANKLPRLNRTYPTDITLSRQSFCNLFANLSVVKPAYCQEGDTTNIVTAGYYSTEGVCLPRFYGNPNDPSSIYTLAVVSFNFAAFAYMFVAYIFIYRATSFDKHHAHDNGATTCDARSKENQALWGKIFRLILTDFLCWIPICILSFLSYGGTAIPSVFYPATAIYLIPVNSAANPWIYSSFLLEYVKKIWTSNRGLKFFCLHNRSIQGRDRNRNPESRRNKASIDITMGPSFPSSVMNNTNDGLTMATEL